MAIGTLRVRDLCKSYRGRKVVQEVSLTLRQGDVVGLLGPNGAGKTTTFYMIVGLISPDTGQVLINDSEITSMPMYQRARSGISYLPQEPSVFRKLTVEENLETIAETLDLNSREQGEIVTELLEEFGIAHLRRQPAYTLSGGERRRLEIARALVLTPKFILLDEPFAGIDPLAVLDIQRVIGQLKERRIGVLVTDHNVREALNITDHAYIINDGRILRDGSPEELSNDVEVKKVYLGENFRLN
ncbi:MAG: LPS export ABC transporter ATP-binding protein [Acidobacteria bacterium]|nr:MAG: LPS export ABC transporter ATP-binding protein [Acidobacteriota bacterium]PYV00077.1 MAG: LPS export ABC transporter ATP-binding protein [Acidobacteriota bacterium]PYV42663.1 MAG: LPS export ABC transporter ATP-binding protein [Acidobacteriota bacterium]